MKDINSSDPLAHTENIKQEMQKLVDHLRRDVDKVEEPQAKALFETSAEVMEGLIAAFSHYEDQSESAWQ